MAFGLLDIFGLSAISNMASGGLNYLSQVENRNLQREQFNESMEFNREQADVNRTFAHDEAELSRQFNAEQAEQAFQREADYNSYESQLSRMREAGINPNTIAQQLSSSANATAASSSPASAGMASAPSVPNYTAPNFDFISKAINDTFNNYLMRKQADQAGANAKSIEEMIPFNKRQVEAAIDKAKADARLSDEQANQIKTLTPLLENKTKEEVNQIIATTKAALADADLKKSQLTGQNLENLSKEVVKGIAQKYGIVVDGNSMTTLITTLLTPEGERIIGDIITNLFGGIGHAIREGFQSIPSLLFK